MTEPDLLAEIADLKRRVQSLEESRELMAGHIGTVAWLHHELIMGMRMAAAKRAMKNATPDQIAQLIQARLVEQKNSQGQ